MTGGPSPNGANGERDRRGRFAPGCRGGPGNPLARQSEKLRAELVRAVKADFPKIAETLIQRACAGEEWAMRMVLDRALGPIPKEIEVPQPLAAVQNNFYGSMTLEQQAEIDRLAKLGLASLAESDDENDGSSRPARRSTGDDDGRPIPCG